MRILYMQILPMACASLVFIAGNTEFVSAQERTIIYRSLDLIEEPLAVEIGDVTYTLRGTVDVPFTVNLQKLDDNDFGITSALRLGAETQLSNSWTLKGTYTVGYDSSILKNNGFEHKLAGSLGSSIGKIHLGHVSDLLRMETDRKSGVGNADLAFDGSLAELDDLSVAGISVLGPLRIGGVIDKVANFDLGFRYQRPNEKFDHRYSMRLTKGDFAPADSSKNLDAIGIHGVGELIYGSSKFNLGAGYERITSTQIEANRTYITAGTNTKIGPISLSAEGHYGQIADGHEYSASLGAAYDFARGASVNAGINYKNGDATRNGVKILSGEEIKAKLSLRYGF